MSFFDIQLESTRSQYCKEGGVDGQIVIGSFREQFFSPTTWWSENQYRSDWRRNIQNLVNGADKAILLTTMQDLEQVNFLFAWILYSAEDSETTVYVRNQMLFPDRFPSIHDPDRLVEVANERDATTEDGEPISEWTTTVGALKDFLRRQSD